MVTLLAIKKHTHDKMATHSVFSPHPPILHLQFQKLLYSACEMPCSQ
ncbi:unnamed protein product [Brassica oleracea var. botrytis]